MTQTETLRPEATHHAGVPGWACGAVILVCLIPVLLTPVFPFVDFYSHIARYYVLAHIDRVPVLAENYEAAWMLLPNLGLDLVGTGLMKLLPPLVVGQVIGTAVILAPLLGVMLLSRALHGHVTWPALLLGGILAFSHVLIWGFANFLLGLGLILAGLAFWIMLASRPALQLAVALPFAVLLFFVHGLAFAFWGLFLGCVELMLAWQARDLRPGRLALRVARLASLAVIPMLLFLQMPTAGAEGGITPAASNLRAHAEAGNLWSRVVTECLSRIDVTLRVADSGFPVIDRFLGILLWGGLALGVLRGVFRLDPRLWLACAMAALLVVIMPPSMFGVGYLNDRAPLLLLALIAAGLSVPDGTLTLRRLQRGGLVFLAGLFVLRTALTGIGWAQDGRVYTAFLDTLAAYETGDLGVPYFYGATGARDAPSTQCKPLSFMMLMQNDTAVNMFAFATQQPIRRDGPLKAFAEERPGSKDAISAIIICSPPGSPAPAPQGFAEMAAAAPWTLYLRAP